MIKKLKVRSELEIRGYLGLFTYSSVKRMCDPSLEPSQ